MLTQLLMHVDGHWGGPWWGGTVFFLFFVLIFGLFAFKFFWWRPWRWHGGWYGAPAGPEEVLRLRLARGEISEADFERLSEVLKKG
jgi:uncharacterized membrane protein